MQIYLAPLQGLTDWIFRESFVQNIGTFDKYFSPFIRVQDGEFFRPSQCKDILPEHNKLQKPVPQFLGNDPESFKLFEDFCDRNGYTSVNINLGCPFTKVAGRGLGAGMLSNPADVAHLLQGIFASTKLTVSVKCRLGQDDVAEFNELVAIFNDNPIEEIIIHPRTGKQLYKGELYRDEFIKQSALLKHPVCYNGDIVSLTDIADIQRAAPNITRFMIGRGVFYNPFLVSEIKGETLTPGQKKEKLRQFHLGLLERCKQKYSGDFSVLKRFEEMWTLHCEFYDDGRKILKQVKKCHSVVQYESIMLGALNQARFNTPTNIQNP